MVPNRPKIAYGGFLGDLSAPRHVPERSRSVPGGAAGLPQSARERPRRPKSAPRASQERPGARSLLWRNEHGNNSAAQQRFGSDSETRWQAQMCFVSHVFHGFVLFAHAQQIELAGGENGRSGFPKRLQTAPPSVPKPHRAGQNRAKSGQSACASGQASKGEAARAIWLARLALLN